MDRAALVQAVGLFKAEFPDFVSFEQPGEQLKNQELQYKQVISQAFKDFIAPFLDSGAASQQTGFVAEFKQFLDLIHPGIEQAQNFVNWRDRSRLFNQLLENQQTKTQFTRLSLQLLEGADNPESVSPQLDQFCAWIADQGGMAGDTKIWPTLMLFLYRPDLYLFIKPSFIDNSLQLFGFEKTGQGKILTGKIYARVMRDMESIKQALKDLKPADFIDVQSFLWVVFNSSINSSPKQLGSTQYRGNLKAWLAELHQQFLESSQAWIARYSDITHAAVQARQDPERLDQELLSRLWFERNNGVADVGQGQLSSSVFAAQLELLKQLTQIIFERCDQTMIDEIILRFEQLKDKDLINWIPKLVVNRLFCAVYPEQLTTVASEKHMNELCGYLVNIIGVPLDAEANWVNKNRQVLTFFAENGLDTTKPAQISTFAWYLLEYFRDQNSNTILQAEEPKTQYQMAEPMNRIIYGPPGTGKTYKLQQDYIPRYISQPDKFNEQEWIAEIIEGMKWAEVIAAALLDLGNGVFKVKQITEHPYLQIKRRLRGLEKVDSALIWATLQEHTSFENEHVNTKNRWEPFWFWKEQGSTWRLADDWQETGENVIDAVAKIRLGPSGETEAIKRYEFITFHQSYSYEDFVEGIRPVMGDTALESGGLRYELRPGVFLTLCERARSDSENRYALFIDEINRGNISKIFGELITLIELDKRQGKRNELSVRLPYSKTKFSVPENLDIVGTMNTADRSLAHIDTAFRRRFEFEELLPTPSLLQGIEVTGGVDLVQMLTAMNQRIEVLFDREHAIGHSYFIKLNSPVSLIELSGVFMNNILPLLTEYFFDDWSRIRAVLADDQTSDKNIQFVLEKEIDTSLFGASDIGNKNHIFTLNIKAFNNPETYKKIYTELS